MKIAIVAAEIAPWAKEGGLGDVLAAQPLAFKQLGAEPILILPGYRALLSQFKTETVAQAATIPFGGRMETFSVMRANGPHGIPMYLVAHSGFFDRDGIYGERGTAYPDNVRRFILFGRAAAMIAANYVQPDVVHAHDWHAAATTVAMRAESGPREKLRGATSVFTIHNLAYQGNFASADYALLGIDPSYFSVDGLEFFGRVNLMKGAILMSDGVTTVSPSYAIEAATDPAIGFGLDGVLRDKGDHFRGIGNGVDYDEWNPASDRLIAATYSPGRVEGKRACKRDLQGTVKLPSREDVPLIGMVSRMTNQKGFDLLHDAFDRLMEMDLQLVMLASGDRATQAYFRGAERLYPGKFRLVSRFDDTLAHKIQAGSDAFLMPSRFEPCGLTQMYALKYGTVPIVRATGGLRDSVSEFDPATGRGNGFVFEAYRADDLIAALGRMMAAFHDRKRWRKIMSNCFAADFSWERAARDYLGWFEQLQRERRAVRQPR